MAFGKVPLLQIDGQEVVETQAMIRYLAKRANLTGKTATDELYCDMIACNILDLIKVVVAAPFKRYQNEESGKEYINTMKVAWRKAAVRLEMCIEKNSRKGKIGAYLVGDCVTYVDVLLAHVVTWFAEECGGGILEDMPYCVQVQHNILAKESLQKYLGGPQFYKLGDDKYCRKVSEVLGREVK